MRGAGNGGPAGAPGAPEGIAAEIVNLPPDGDWLAREVPEEVLEPDLPIVDAHHHTWDRPGARYLPPDLLSDLGAGHRITATVHVENGAAYRPDGPAAMRPVGETEVMAAIPAGWEADAAGAQRIHAGLVGYADLLAGADAAPVLEAHVEAGRGRFRGIRQVTAWNPAPGLQVAQHDGRRGVTEGMLADPGFREGFARLAPLGLTFDAWLYHPQLGELAELARAFPETGIVVNHVGGPIGVGPYAARRDEAHAEWSAAMAELAGCPNVSVKLGGLGMRLLGFALQDRAVPPASAELAELWRPYVEPCIERFGAGRCMFESNFPVDKAYYSYRACWNAFKRLTAGASAGERRDLFSGTARRVYRLPS